MSTPFSLILDATINEGQETTVHTAATNLCTDVENNEPDVLHYRCFVDTNTNRICFLDTYGSSEAFLNHAARGPVNEALNAILGNCTVNNFLVFGDVTPGCREALTGMGATIIPEHAGFDRVLAQTA